MNNQISAESLQPVLHDGVTVITTELLAQLYGTESVRIRQNHHENKTRFIEGKHYVKVAGKALTDLRLSLSEPQNQSADLRVALNYSQNQSVDLQISPKARSLILWTERGAARHAKMLETDQAWEVFEKLEDFYFTKGEVARERGQESAPATQAEIDAYYAIAANEQAQHIRKIWDKELAPLLKSIKSPLLGRLNGRILEIHITTRRVRDVLSEKLPDGAIPRLF